MVPGIYSPILFSGLSNSVLSPQDRDILASKIILTYVYAILTVIHETIIDGWEQFAENQKEIREQKDDSDQARELRNREVQVQQLEGARRLSEALNTKPDEIPSIYAFLLPWLRF